jgi:hypothetical protein
MLKSKFISSILHANFQMLRTREAIAYCIRYMIIVIPILSSGCCISIQGQSSEGMKHELMDSYLFKSAKRFYPEGAPKDPARISPNLNGQQLIPIQEELITIASALRKTHEKKFAALTAYRMPQMKKKVDSRIEVISKQSTAANTDENGRITIDVRVLQSIFRGAVLETYLENRQSTSREDLPPTPKYGFEDAYDPKTATADQVAAIEQLLRLVEEIEKMPGHSIIGDFAGAMRDDGFESSWFKMANLKSSSLGLQTKYAGAIMFLLAHEQGHLVLDHHARWNSLKRDPTAMGSGYDANKLCDVRRSFEAEADAYALLLLSPYLTERGVGMLPSLGGLGLFDDMLRNSVGFRNFFIYGYNLSGFNENKGQACVYETNRARLQRLEGLNKSLQDASEKKFDEALQKKWDEALEKALRGH